MRSSFIRRVTTVLGFIIIFCNSSIAQTDFYWGGGSGDWDDASHWYKEASAINNTGSVPGENSIVKITNNSFSPNSNTLIVPPGSYDVHSILVQTNEDFLLKFDGASNNDVIMNVYGNLNLRSTHRLEYANSSNSYDNYNKWVFKKSSNQQNITTGNQDLLRVQFLNEGVTYSQQSNLKASQQIRMYGGIWNTNGYNVNTGTLLFYDGINSGGTQLSKVFNADGSNVLCETWDSDLTYGSFSITGNHTIYTNSFDGSPPGAFDDIFPGPFTINEVHLLEYPDNPPGGVVIEYNNFECTDCIVESMVIEDTGRTKLAGAFTLNGKLTVVNTGMSIEFNAGNGRSNEVTINGIVIVPQVTSCGERTTFTNVHSDFTSLTSIADSLIIDDAILVNIEATGGTDFILSNGVLQGSSTGWNVINTSNPTDYYWVGEIGEIKSWNNPNFWTLVDGSNNGCVPSIVDNVYITTSSKGGIRVPANYTATCRNFIWTNMKDFELRLEGTTSLGSTLKVTENFQLDQTAIVTGLLDHRLIFSSSTNSTIETQGVQLPNVLFVGDDAEWSLLDGFSCDRLDFEAGTLKTEGYDVTTDLWMSIEENPKHYDFSSSHIKVNGIFTLSLNSNSGVTVDAGSSLIECENLISSILELYNVRLNNSSALTLQSYPYVFNGLILNGTGEVSTQHDLTLSTLRFKRDNSILAIDEDYELIINSGIIGTDLSSSPGVLKSKTLGSRAEIESDGNICAQGYVSFTDIQSVLAGVFHAPDGIDNGNNDAIVFDSGTTSNTLYWIKEDGGNWLQESNWSRVDGGCPSTKDPSTAANLEFNQNSFTASPVTVTIPEFTTAKNIYFKNSEDLTVDVRVELDVPQSNNIIVDGGYVNFVGKILDVSGKIDVQSSGIITTDMTNFISNELEVSSGAFVVRSGSDATIKN